MINSYRDISFNDKFRYKIDINNNNNSILIYNIKPRTEKYNIKIISFPYFNQKKKIFKNYKLMIEFFDILENEIPKKIHYIFLTIDEKKKLDKSEIIFFYLFINLFKKEHLKNRINILITPDDSLKNTQKNNTEIIINLFNTDFLFEENVSQNFFSSLLNKKLFYINSKIIFVNNENSEKEWKILNDEIIKLKNKISSASSIYVDNDKIDLMKDIFSSKEKHRRLPKFDICEREIKIILMNYLLNYDPANNNLILNLYNKIENKHYDINEKEIDFSYLESNKLLYIFSKIKFNNLKAIKYSKKDLNDEYLNLLSNLFSTNLKSLNLSNNKITNMKIFNNENNLINLENLDLSFNNITNINVLTKFKFPNLNKLVLSHNKIIDIDCLENEISNLGKLKILDLSYNKIKKLNKITIINFCALNLLNNYISSGINNFIEHLEKYKNIKIDVKIEYINDNELIFNYLINSNNLSFNYIIEKGNMNNFLEKLEFSKVETLTIKGFNNINFLCNKSLNMIKNSDLKENSINDIKFISDDLNFLKKNIFSKRKK